MTYWYIFNSGTQKRYGCKVIKDSSNNSYIRSSYLMNLDDETFNYLYYDIKFHNDMDYFTKEDFENLSKISWDFSKGAILEMYPSGNYGVIEDGADQEICIDMDPR